MIQSSSYQNRFSQKDFEDLKNFIEEWCGIEFSENNRYILERRVQTRIEALKLKSPRDYYFFIRYSPKRHEEVEKLINILTTNETYFFREKHQLKAFSEEILPELHRNNRESRSLRVWSAGCSTGEEPYTIAILIIESKLFHNWNVEIFATDINTEVLQHAREAVYTVKSFRDTEQRYLRDFFDKLDGGRYVVKPEVRSLVNFGKLNLLDTGRIRMLPRFDVIFCRNVLIYFTQEAKKKVSTAFFDSLKDGGYLLLGHAESLINISSDFELVHFKNDIVYRKPRRGEDEETSSRC